MINALEHVDGPHSRTFMVYLFATEVSFIQCIKVYTSMHIGLKWRVCVYNNDIGGIEKPFSMTMYIGLIMKAFSMTMYISFG
jgi:hypothetical protein